MLKQLQRNGHKDLEQYLVEAGGTMQRLDANKTRNAVPFAKVPAVSLVIDAKRVQGKVRLLLPDGLTYAGNTEISNEGVGEVSRKEPMLLVRGNVTSTFTAMEKGRKVKREVYGNAKVVPLNLVNFRKYHRAVGLDKSVECLFWTLDMEDVWRDIEVI
jgi:hypothetical protein